MNLSSVPAATHLGSQAKHLLPALLGAETQLNRVEKGARRVPLFLDELAVVVVRVSSRGRLLPLGRSRRVVQIRIRWSVVVLRRPVCVRRMPLFSQPRVLFPVRHHSERFLPHSRNQRVVLVGVRVIRFVLIDRLPCEQYLLIELVLDGRIARGGQRIMCQSAAAAGVGRDRRKVGVAVGPRMRIRRVVRERKG